MKVFLSHSSRDKQMARQLALDLRMSSIDVWLDEWAIRIGDSITQKISRGLDDCALVIVMLSAASVDSGWVEKEWSSRFGEEASSQRVIVMPVQVEDCTVPVLLRDKRRADLRQNYSEGLRELIESVLKHGSEGAVVGVGARIRSGRIVFERVDPDMPLLRGMITTIEEGCFVRHEGQLQVHVHTVGPRQDFQDFAERTGMSRLTLTSTDFVVSADPGRPSVFSGRHPFFLPRGHRMADFGTGVMVTIPFDLRGDFVVNVSASSGDSGIAGTFEQIVTYAPPCPIPRMHAHGSFTARVDVE